LYNGLWHAWVKLSKKAFLLLLENKGYTTIFFQIIRFS
jgi:hypothetical protein